MNLASSARRKIAAFGTILAIGAVSGCSGGENAVPGGQQAAQGIVDRAPVATEAELAASPTAQAIRKRGELLVGSVLDTPLLSQQNPATGEAEGFDALLSKMLAKYIVGTPNRRIVNGTPQTREALLSNGTVDTIFMAYGIKPERAAKVGFAGPYFTSGTAIATLKSTGDITKAADLNGKKVLVLSGSSAVDELKTVAPGTASVQQFPSTQEAVQALVQGRGDAFASDLVALAGAAYTENRIKVADARVFVPEAEGIGVRHGDDTFKKFVNDWLKKIEDAKLWHEAYKETFGKALPDVPEPPKIGDVPGL
ncbi:transporter substrate-binding domain-containing protein [Amycolatopsis sp. NPDC059021]|uniref:transporter substrate-binding domain-containing protein n=1 Tax=Amycolatopsis sp. NPDC059021 TaxID=3346704 RepID=UPI00366CF4AE